MKLFILGAGYVGKACLAHLKNQDHIIYASTTRDEKVLPLKSYTEHVLVLKGSEKAKIKEIIDKCDAMIILVAQKDDNYEETYLTTAKIVACALEERSKPFFLLYTSSTSIYEGLTGWAREEDLVAPQSVRTQILLETEKIYLACAKKQVTSCILRLGGIYGPERELSERARRFSGKEMNGTGAEWTNHIHLEDIVSALEFCLTNRLSGIYNLVNNDHPSREKLYTELCQSLNLVPPKWGPCTKGEASGYRVSNNKILSKGFKFKHPTLFL